MSAENFMVKTSAVWKDLSYVCWKTAMAMMLVRGAQGFKGGGHTWQRQRGDISGWGKNGVWDGWSWADLGSNPRLPLGQLDGREPIHDLLSLHFFACDKGRKNINFLELLF